MSDFGDIDFDNDSDWDENLDLTSNKVNKMKFTIDQNQENDVKGLERKHYEVLSRCFGHTKFRALQWKIIRSIIIDKKDVCAVMATGYGKSLCYQFPSVYSGGITIVISPLISLMEDQVLSLKMSNISACLLGSAQTQKSKVLSDIMSNEYRIIYATPEFCTGENGMDFLAKVNDTLNVDLLAIDEAHCVSQWGHDFRVKYRHLSKVRSVLSNVPVLAVTATATEDVRNDIIMSLKLRNPNIYCSGFDRPNLFFEVVLRNHSDPLANLKSYMIKNQDGYKFTGSTIIYCLTRKQTEEVARNLSFNKVKCLTYHAALSMGDRKKAHEMFAKDEIKVIVATIAFGMGIDKPDVRMVIHYGGSKDIESYYQEVGRAGRDGLPSKCILLHSSADFHTHENIREMSNYGSAKQKELKEKSSKLMQKYIDTLECRRKFILEYFQDDASVCKEPRDTCCDNCKLKTKSGSTFYDNYDGLDANGKYNLSEEARLFLGVVQSLNGKYGIAIYILTLRGSKSAKVNYMCQKSKLYGEGKHHNDEWWKFVGSVLEREGFLKKVRVSKGTFSYSTIDLSPKGISLLQKLTKNPDTDFRVMPTKEMVKMLKNKKPQISYQSQNWNDTPSSSSNSKVIIKELGKITQEVKQEEKKKQENEEDPVLKNYRMDLYNKLISKRSDIAHERECMPYMVGSNTALMAMSKLRPKSIEDLKSYNYDGFTEAKIENFGKIYVNFIKEYCIKNPPPDNDNENGIKMDDPKSNYATCSLDLLNHKFSFKAKKDISVKDEPENVNLNNTTARLDQFHDLLVDNLDLSGDWDDWNDDKQTDRNDSPNSEPAAKKQKLPELKEETTKRPAKKNKAKWDWD